MWWRFVVFCFLVSFILFMVLNFLHDRPVVHFRFFKRCCEDGIENDQIVYERFKDNFLKERLVAFEIEADNGTFVPEDVDIEEIIEVMRGKLNVHSPDSRRIVDSLEELFTTTDYGLTSMHEHLDEDLNDDKNLLQDINDEQLDMLNHENKQVPESAKDNILKHENRTTVLKSKNGSSDNGNIDTNREKNVSDIQNNLGVNSSEASFKVNSSNGVNNKSSISNEIPVKISKAISTNDMTKETKVDAITEYWENEGTDKF